MPYRPPKGITLLTAQRDVASATSRSLLSRGNVARSVTLALALAFNLSVARTLGANNAGPVFTAVIIVTLAGMVGRIGTDQYVLKHASAWQARDALTLANLRWVSIRRTCWLGSTAATLVVGGVGVGMLLTGGHSPLAKCLSIFALSIPFQCTAILDSALLRVVGRVATGAFAEVGMSQGLAAGTLIGFHVAGVATPVTAGIALVCGSVVTAGWSALQVRHAGILKGTGTPAKLPSTALAEMSHMMTSSTLFFTMAWMPVGALWLFSTPASVSVLTVAARFPNLLSIVPNIQITAAVPRLAALHHAGDVGAVNAAIVKLNRGAALVAVPIAGLFIAAAPLVMGAFGRDFVSGGGALRALMIGQLGVVLAGFVIPIMLFAGLERVAVAVTVAALLVGFPVVCAASYYAGPLGAAAASAFVMCAHAGVSAIIVYRRTRIFTAFTIRSASSA